MAVLRANDPSGRNKGESEGEGGYGWFRLADDDCCFPSSLDFKGTAFEMGCGKFGTGEIIGASGIRLGIPICSSSIDPVP